MTTTAWGALGVLLAGLVAVVVGVGLRWRDRARARQAPPALPPDLAPVIGAALEPIRVRVDEALADIQDAEESPTPATDTAALAKLRARKPPEDVP